MLCFSDIAQAAEADAAAEMVMREEKLKKEEQYAVKESTGIPPR